MTVKDTSGCVTMYDFPAAGASEFKFYTRSKRWYKGRRSRRDSCVEQACSPRKYSGYDTKETCEVPENAYCEGRDCKFCEYDEYWDYTS
jgi:hypothetical protein